MSDLSEQSCVLSEQFQILSECFIYLSEQFRKYTFGDKKRWLIAIKQ